MKILPFILIIILFSSCRQNQIKKIDFSKHQETANIDTVSDHIKKIGIAAMLSPNKAMDVYEEMVDYIGKKLGYPTQMIFTKDYLTMNEMVKDQKVLAAFVCSGPYAKSHDEWGMELIAAPSMYGEHYYYSYLIVNSKSQYKSLNDLKNKRFAFTDPESNTGKLVPEYELLLKETTPEKFFHKIIYTGSHDKSIEAVANNLVDGAAVDNLIWEYYSRADSAIASKTKVIARFGPFCTPPVVVNPNLRTSLKDSIRQVFLTMNQNKEGNQIIKKLYIDHFDNVDDSAYNSIRNMQRNLIVKKH